MAALGHPTIQLSRDVIHHALDVHERPYAVSANHLSDTTAGRSFTTNCHDTAHHPTHHHANHHVRIGERSDYRQPLH